MNFHHFMAIVRMRWQMARNRFSKSSSANRFFSVVMTVLAALGSLGLFFLAVGWSNWLLDKFEPLYMMYVWDAVVGVFLFGWSITLMVELQQSELMSLKNLLHLPISLRGAFLLNYSSSWVSLVLFLLCPGMLGLCVACVIRFGPASLVVFVLLFAFLFMVTAVTYQIRGYLARLMENKRTRGTVVVVMTIGFVLMSQAPQLVTTRMFRDGVYNQELQKERDDQLSELASKLTFGEIDGAQFKVESEKIESEYVSKFAADSKQKVEGLNAKAKLANAVLPIGWLPYGASAAAGGSLFIPWLCVFGMSAIGSTSLALAYRSTLATYTGQRSKSFRADQSETTNVAVGGGMLEKNIPLLSHQQSVVALATLRSTIRAPESKMALLTPLIFFCIFGFSAFNGRLTEFPEAFRPYYGIAAIGIMLMGTAQLMLNIFGLDRQGFRAYVLSPLRRRDILLGKNMGLMPFSAGLSILLVIVFAVIGKMHLSHLLGTIIQCVIAQLLFLLVGNYISIYAPNGLTPGSMKPKEMSFKTFLLQVLSLIFVPISMLPAAVSLSVELFCETFDYTSGVPIYLILSLITLPIVVAAYRWAITTQGRWLQDREQEILEVISKVAD